MGYPTWLIDELSRQGWKYKKPEAKKYKIYQAPTSSQRVLIHKNSNVDERVVLGILRKTEMSEQDIRSFIEQHSKHIIKPPSTTRRTLK